VPRWVDTVLTERPYASRQALLTAAGELAGRLTPDETHEAMAGHHESASAGPVTSSPAPNSPEVDASLADRLRAANGGTNSTSATSTSCSASGRGGEELLAILESRLDNDPATELGVVTRSWPRSQSAGWESGYR